MICFSVIDRCNWDCDYCIAGTQRRYNKNKPALTEEKFKKMLKDIDETSTKLAINFRDKSNETKDRSFVLSGGEPGLLSTEEIIQVIQRIHPNVELTVNTNGLFLQKIDTKIFELMIHKFKAFNIRWHLFEDSSCILESPMSGIELARKFIVYQDYLPYIEFQMLLTDKEITNNLNKTMHHQ
mgnify:FL=1